MNMANKARAYTNRLQAKYETEVKSELVKKFNYTSVMQAPKIEKVVINIGCGDAV
jgi:large subunit ribosomal protein L5